jgi:hypothetical protein
MVAADITTIRQQWQAIFPREPEEGVTVSIRVKPRRIAPRRGDHEGVGGVGEAYLALRQAKGEYHAISHELIEWSHKRECDREAEAAAILTLESDRSITPSVARCHIDQTDDWNMSSTDSARVGGSSVQRLAYADSSPALEQWQGSEEWRESAMGREAMGGWEAEGESNEPGGSLDELALRMVEAELMRGDAYEELKDQRHSAWHLTHDPAYRPKLQEVAEHVQSSPLTAPLSPLLPTT